MTQQEIKDTIKDLKEGLNSSFTPEQFKPRMEAKIKELEAQLSTAKAPAEKPTKFKSNPFNKFVNDAQKRASAEFKAKQEREQPPTPERKKSVPQPKAKEEKYPEDEDDYCAKVIAQAKERRRKAKERAKLPKKTEATKNKEKLEKVFDNVKERAEDNNITKAELVKLISETKSLLTMLEKKLASL